MIDLKLSFINDKLSKEQLQMAQKVAKAAAAMGIDPSFAVSIAFKEGSLDPKTIDSPKGAIGMMQVKPSTGAAYGYSEADLRDADKNLEAGLKNLKESLAYANNKPMLAAVYYHSGPDAIKDQAAGKPLGPNALEYIKALKGFNTFELFNPDFKAPAESQDTQQAASAETPPETPPTDAPPPSSPPSLGNAREVTPEQDFIRENSLADLRRQQYGLVGAGTGTALALAPYAGRTAASTLGNLAKTFNEAKAPTPAAPTAPMGGLPTGGAPTPPQMGAGAPTGGLPSPQGQPVMGVADAGRMAQGQTGVIPYNTAKALGLTDIEAGQALTNTKQEGGAWDLAEKRREGLTKVQSMAGNRFVENPMYGGLLTQAPSVGGGPRESFVMRPEVPANPDLPSGQPAQLAPLPKAPIVSTVPPPLSGLDQAKNIFMGMMRQGAKYLPVVGPPLAGYSIARDVADIESQYDRAPINRDYTDIGLSGASALATGASLYPPAFPVAAPLSVAIPTFRNIRRNVLAQESDPELQKRNRMEPTEEEIEMASRPYIGYPRQTGQKPFQPRPPPLGTVPPSVIIGN
jgi:hypothetical protein